MPSLSRPNSTNRTRVLVAECDLLAPFVAWLAQHRTIRADSYVITEFPLYGRRVDLVVLTRSGVATAYEFKLCDTQRAVEQAALNAVTFDRSVIVSKSRPTARYLAQARALGLGVTLMTGSPPPELVIRPAKQAINPIVRRRLRSRIVSGVGHPYVWT